MNWLIVLGTPSWISLFLFLWISTCAYSFRSERMRPCSFSPLWQLFIHNPIDVGSHDSHTHRDTRAQKHSGHLFSYARGTRCRTNMTRLKNIINRRQAPKYVNTEPIKPYLLRAILNTFTRLWSFNNRRCQATTVNWKATKATKHYQSSSQLCIAWGFPEFGLYVLKCV